MNSQPIVNGKPFDIELYRVWKKIVILVRGLCLALSALHSHCRTEILKKVISSSQKHISKVFYQNLRDTAVKYATSKRNTLAHILQHEVSFNSTFNGTIYDVIQLHNCIIDKHLHLSKTNTYFVTKPTKHSWGNIHSYPIVTIFSQLHSWEAWATSNIENIP